MDVKIVVFPETKVAAVEHRGPPELEHETARRLIAWRALNRLSREEHQSYGIHYTDPYTTPPCSSTASGCRASGETLRDFPIFFHYLNVGPDVREEDMITDVYLPLA